MLPTATDLGPPAVLGPALKYITVRRASSLSFTTPHKQVTHDSYIMSTSRQEQHDLRQQHEHAEALRRKAERREAHERRMRQQAEDAARARAERARRHKELKEEEGRRRREKETRRWGTSGGPSSDSANSRWSEHDYTAYSQKSTRNPSLEQEHAAVARYEDRWERMMLLARGGVSGQVRFTDIPWPGVRLVSTLNDLVKSNIEPFVLSKAVGPELDRRVRLRAYMLQWHPDKFIGRWLHFVYEPDRAIVQEGITSVMSILNELFTSSNV